MAHKCYILGGGESGAGAAILAKKQGYDVFVSDAGPIKNIYKEELKAVSHTHLTLPTNREV